jgi:hypothetical protein
MGSGRADIRDRRSASLRFPNQEPGGAVGPEQSGEGKAVAVELLGGTAPGGEDDLAYAGITIEDL